MLVFPSKDVSLGPAPGRKSSMLIISLEALATGGGFAALLPPGAERSAEVSYRDCICTDLKTMIVREVLLFEEGVDCNRIEANDAMKRFNDDEEEGNQGQKIIASSGVSDLCFIAFQSIGSCRDAFHEQGKHGTTPSYSRWFKR